MLKGAGIIPPKTTVGEERELRVVCSQFSVKIIPLSSKTGSGLERGSKRKERERKKKNLYSRFCKK